MMMMVTSDSRMLKTPIESEEDIKLPVNRAMKTLWREEKWELLLDGVILLVEVAIAVALVVETVVVLEVLEVRMVVVRMDRIKLETVKDNS